MKHTKSMIYSPSIEADELKLYADNNGALYRNMITPTIDNLKRKIKRGIFDAAKAVDAFYYVTTEAARRYFTEFGGRFTVSDRWTAAVDMLQDFINDNDINAGH